MKWFLKDQVRTLPAELPDHIERRLQFALARFGDRVEKVMVFLQDRNGPRGGVDKVCRILAKVRGCGAIMATVADSDWVAAVDRATSRIGHTVSRQIGRQRERHAEIAHAGDARELAGDRRHERPGFRPAAAWSGSAGR